MRYLVQAKVKPGKEKLLLEAIGFGRLGRGSVADDMQKARLTEDGVCAWIEVCFCATPLEEERPYWEQYFDLLLIKDAHARKNCRDANGTEPWACCDCDCTQKLEERLLLIGDSFLNSLKAHSHAAEKGQSHAPHSARLNIPKKCLYPLSVLRLIGGKLAGREVSRDFAVGEGREVEKCWLAQGRSCKIKQTASQRAAGPSLVAIVRSDIYGLSENPRGRKSTTRGLLAKPVELWKFELLQNDYVCPLPIPGRE